MDLKLCDFGLSTKFNSMSTLTDFCGSPGTVKITDLVEYSYVHIDYIERTTITTHENYWKIVVTLNSFFIYFYPLVFFNFYYMFFYFHFHINYILFVFYLFIYLFISFFSTTFFQVFSPLR